MTNKIVTRKRQGAIKTTMKCGMCHKEYDLGEPTIIGSFHYWPKGERAYWKHATANHGVFERYDKAGLACGGACIWHCSICGATRTYRSAGPRHVGPPDRLIDRRYGLAYCQRGRYPAHKRAYGLI